MFRLSRAVYFTLTLLLVCYLAIGYSLKVPQINSALKDLVQTRLADTFDAKVTISTLSGTLFSGIEFNDLNIYDSQNKERIFLKAGTMRVFPSPKVFLGILSNPISNVTFEDVQLDIIRNKQKKVNVIEFLKSSKGSSGGLKFRIDFKNISGTYEDSRGWGRKASFFKVPFSDGAGVIMVDSQTKTALSFNLLIQGASDRSQIEGELTRDSFHYEFNANSLETNYWASYLVPFPKIKVSDDYLQVSGTIKSNPKGSKKKISYELAMDFDYLNVYPEFLRYPFNNVSGRVVLSNYSGVKLDFFNVRAEMSQVPLKVSGDIRLDKKFVNLSMATTQSIDSKDLLSRFSGIKSDFFEFDASVMYKIRGSYKNVKQTLYLRTSPIYSKFFNIDPLHLKFSKQARRSIYVQSLPLSSHFVSGNISNDSYVMEIMDFPLDIPILNSSVSTNIEVRSVPFSNQTSIKVANLNIPILGVQLDSIDTNIIFEKQNIDVPSFVINLDNGQNLEFSAKYSQRDFYFEQKALAENAPSGKRYFIESMISTGNISYYNNVWDIDFNADFVGVGMVYNNQFFDKVSLGYEYRNNSHIFAFNELILDDSKIKGKLELSEQKVASAEFLVTNGDLSRLSYLISKNNSYALNGVLNGQFKYLPGNNNQLFLAMKIQNFKTTYGQFGDVDIVLERLHEDINIRTLKLSGLHRLNLTGEILSNGQFNVKQEGKGVFRLGALDYFSRQKLYGDVSLIGQFNGTLESVNFSGVVESQGLTLDNIPINYFLFDGKKKGHYLQFDKLQVQLNEGQFFASGFTDLPENGEVGADVDYDLKLRFHKLALNDVSNLYAAISKRIDDFTFSKVVPSSLLTNKYIYHKYKADNLSVYNNFLQSLEENKINIFNVVGNLSGHMKINTRDLGSNDINILLNNFSYRDYIEADMIQLVSKTILPTVEYYDFYVDQFKINNSTIDEINAGLTFNKIDKLISVSSLSVDYLNSNFKDILFVDYNFDKKLANFNLNLNDDEINILSIFFSRVYSIANQGRVHVQLSGPISSLKINKSILELNQFKMNIRSLVDAQQSDIFISKFKSENIGSQINLNNLLINWQGDHTFRRVTRENNKNQFFIDGSITLGNIDITEEKEVPVNYDISLRETFFSVNFPQRFTGDILANNIQLKGNQRYSWNKQNRELVAASLGTLNEVGPKLSGSMVFRDGIFNIPKPKAKLKRPRVQLDLTTFIGPGNYIQGSFIGDGLYQFASNVSLEIDDRKNTDPFQIRGYLNAPQFSTRLYFFEGSVSLLDGVYELMNKNEQNHFFSEMSEQITDQYVELSPIQDGDYLKTALDLRLRALRKIEEKLSSENVRNEQLLYDAVGLSINGDFLRSSKITVFDMGIQNYTLSFPEYEVFGAYEVNFLGTDTMLSQTSLYGLNLLLPKIITNSEDSNLTSYGRQRINSFIRSSIRPYERRIAKRIGLYDFRLNYDFGRTILSSAEEDLVSQDLLGVQLVSNLYRERLFLTLKSDVNLSSDYVNENAKGVKVTQVDFTYYIQPNFTISLKNANEYSEISIFDPRWALSYAYSF